jgi:hypothetical protein
MNTPPWSIKVGNTPLVITAIHNGHEVQEEVAHLFAVNEADL